VIDSKCEGRAGQTARPHPRRGLEDYGRVGFSEAVPIDLRSNAVRGLVSRDGAPPRAASAADGSAEVNGFVVRLRLADGLAAVEPVTGPNRRIPNTAPIRNAVPSSTASSTSRQPR